MVTIKAQIPVEQLDAEYLDTQRQVQAITYVLLNTITEEALDRLIERAERAQTLAPILYPSEYGKAADRLFLLIRHAHIIRDARHGLEQTLPASLTSQAGHREKSC